MLNIFGRAIRCPNPPGARLSSSSRALAHRRHSHPPYQRHGDGEDGVAYTQEEEKEMTEFLDRDLPPHVGGSRQYDPPEPIARPKRTYRHQKQIPTPPWGSSRTAEQTSSSASRAHDSTRDAKSDQPISSTAIPPLPDDVDPHSQSEWESELEEADSSSSTPQSRQKDAPRKRVLKRRKNDPFEPYMEPRTPFIPEGHMAQFPYFALTLKVDPVGLPPSANTILYYLGFRYQRQTLYRKRGSLLALRIRRVKPYLHMQYLSEEEAMRLKTEKREEIRENVERRKLSLGQPVQEGSKLRREQSTGEPPPHRQVSNNTRKEADPTDGADLSSNSEPSDSKKKRRRKKK